MTSTENSFNPAAQIYESLGSLHSTIAYEVQRTLTIRIKALMLLFRVCGYAHFKGGLTKIVLFPVLIAYKVYSEYFLGIELPPQIQAGPGLTIFHGYGLVVHRRAKLGARCMLRQGVCIGNIVLMNGTQSGVPVIGDDVEFGVNAVAIGAIHIGSRSKIGACTVVTKDVPADCSVVGARVRILPHCSASASSTK